MEDVVGEHDAFKVRHSYTPTWLPHTGHRFRVMSYNMLADFYAKSEYSRTELFSYCPAFALSIDYRRRLFLREIRGYHSDVICLQEIDSETFDGDLKTVLQFDGFDGHFLRKGHLPEGLATFYNVNKFE